MQIALKAFGCGQTVEDMGFLIAAEIAGCTR
jgi:hypothetical protein